MNADAELRALPVWQIAADAAAAAAPQWTCWQDDFAAWILHVRARIAEGFDVRMHGRPSDAEALRREAVRLLKSTLSLGLVERHAAELRQLIAEIQSDPVAVKVPGGFATLGWPSLIGKRGGASDPEGALRGWLVRMVACQLPENMSNRYKVIAELVTFAGVECSQQLARAVLLNGRT